MNGREFHIIQMNNLFLLLFFLLNGIISTSCCTREREDRLSSLSIHFYKNCDLHKSYNVTFKGTKMFVQQRIRKIRITKNLKTNKFIMCDTTYKVKEYITLLNEKDISTLLMYIKNLGKTHNCKNNTKVGDDIFYISVKYRHETYKISSITLTNNVAIANLINFIRKKSHIKIEF